MKRTILFLLFAFCMKNAFSSDLLMPNNKVSFNNYIEMIVDDDIKGFTESSDSAIGEKIPTFSASELILLYKKNELAADKKVKGKPLRVKSVAKAIQSDFAGNAYIIANGKNAFESIFLYVNAEDERVLNLSGGSKIDFICVGGGMTVGTPVVKKCEFTDDYLSKLRTNIINSFEPIINGKGKPKSKFEVYLIVLYKLNEDNFESKCEKDKKECMKTLKGLNDIIEANEEGRDKFKKEMEKYKDLPDLIIK